jgi:hypothetical protein
MIAGRITIETPPTVPLLADATDEEAAAYADAEDARNAEVNSEIIRKARALSDGATSVKIEVARPGEDWDVSGDAVEVTFSDPPTIATLPPYSEETP